MQRPLLLRLLLALTVAAPLPLSLLHALPFLLAPIAPPPEGLRLSYGQVVLPFFARVGGAWQQVNLTCTVTLVVGGRAEYSCPNGYAEVVSPYLEKVNNTFFLGPPSRTGSEGLQGAGGVHWYAAAPGSLPATFTTRRLITAELQRRVVVLRALSVAPGDTLLPHLYDWYFDGIDDYIRVFTSAPPANSSLTLATYALLRSAVVPQNLYFISKLERMAIRGHIMGTPNFGMIWCFADLTGDGLDSGIDIRGSWRHMVMVYDNVSQRMYLYLDAMELTGGGRPVLKPLNNGFDYYIAAWGDYYGHIPATISMAFVYSRPLASSEVMLLMQRVVNASGLLFFLDPVMWNGTHYLSLVNGYVARPFNGATRVPAEQVWLWVVKGLRSDTRVGLRFFPAGSVIVFRDASGNPVAVVEADGRDAIEVDLPPSSYTVEAYVPAHSVAVVPHVYDWYFDGVDDYIVTTTPAEPLIGVDFTVSTRVAILRYHNGWFGVIDNGRWTTDGTIENFWLLTHNYSWHIPRPYVNCLLWGAALKDSTYIEQLFPEVEVGRFHAYFFGFEGTKMWYSLDGGGKTVWTVETPRVITARRLTLGAWNHLVGFANVKISHVIIYKRAISQDEMMNPFVVNIEGVSLFLDPIMFNGTHYLSLVNNIAATPYNGATRVPAEQVWLWQVSLAGAGEVVLAWIPPGSFVRVRGGGTEFVALGRRVGDSRVLNLRAVDGSFAVVRYMVELAWFPTATGDWFSFQPSFGYEAWGRVVKLFHWNGTHALPDLPAFFEGHYLMAAVEDPHVPGLISLWVSSGTCYRVPGADTRIYLLRFAPAPELGEGAALPKAYVGDADGAVNVTGLREAIIANLSAGAYLRWQDAAGNPWTAPIHPAWGEVYSVGGVGVRRYLFSVSDMTGKGGVVKIMTMDRTVRCSAEMTPGGLTGLTCPLSYGEAYAVVAVWPDGGSRTSMWFTAGGAVTLNVYVSLVAVTLTQPGNLYVFESAAGRVYVSTDGVSWVELKPLTGAVELKEVKATVRVDIDAVVVGERNVTYTDPFGRTRWRIEPQYRYALRAVSTCLLADRPCGPVRVTVYRPDGTYAGELVLEPPPRGTAAQSIDPWPDPAAIVRVSGFSEFGPYRVEAAQPGLATTGRLPYTYDVRPLLALLPVALFVAFGVRVSLRETALGVFAYGFLAAPLSAALGVPIQAAGAILAVCTAVAAILLLLSR